MGLSKVAFLASKGFGNIHPGEDPDLSIRLLKLGFKTKLITTAYVYHKRRISLTKFYKQVYKFGLVRPILNTWHPETKKITYWFPTLFILGLIASLFLFFLKIKWLVIIYMMYFVLAFLMALVSTKSVVVAFLSLVAICYQFIGYGFGFIKSTFIVQFLKKRPEHYFPDLFFKLR